MAAETKAAGRGGAGGGGSATMETSMVKLFDYQLLLLEQK